MKEGEDIVSYFEKVGNVVNEIREIGDTLHDVDVVYKILITLPVTYSCRISSIQETYDPKTFIREQLFGTLTTFQVRKFGKDKDKLDMIFKESKDGLDDDES